MAPESQGQVIRTTMTALQTNTGSLSANGLSTDGAAQYRKIANPHADVHPGDRPQICTHVTSLLSSLFPTL